MQEKTMMSTRSVHESESRTYESKRWHFADLAEVVSSVIFPTTATDDQRQALLQWSMTSQILQDCVSL